jgi:3-oxoacyl-[acyl-carrier protein] reductase
MLYVGEGAEDQLEGALRFSSRRKAPSSRAGDSPGRLRHAGRGLDPPAGRAQGAGHRRRPGIGASIAETLARDGAEVILLDVPQAKADLEALAARLGARTVAWTSAPKTPPRN